MSVRFRGLLWLIAAYGGLALGLAACSSSDAASNDGMVTSFDCGPHVVDVGCECFVSTVPKSELVASNSQCSVSAATPGEPHQCCASDDWPASGSRCECVTVGCVTGYLTGVRDTTACECGNLTPLSENHTIVECPPLAADQTCCLSLGGGSPECQCSRFSCNSSQRKVDKCTVDLILTAKCGSEATAVTTCSMP